MTDKVKPPTRITVSGGPKAEPRLYYPKQPEPTKWERGDVTTLIVLLASLLIGVVFFVSLLLAVGPR